MKLKMNDPLLRILKVLWLPIVLLFMIVAEPYLGISKTPYAWAYLGIQALLFIAYTYILFKDRPAYTPGNNKKIKGKRKQKK